MIKKIFFCFYLVPFLLFSQEKSTDYLLGKEMQKISKTYPKEKDFIKSHSFFIKKEWDSTLYYTARHLTQSKNATLNNYSHYMRGSAFIQKKIFKQAQSEFRKIDPHIHYFSVVKYRVGVSLLEQEKYEEAIPVFLAIQNDSTNYYYSYLHKEMLNSLGVCYLLLKKFDLAENYLLKYKGLEEKSKDTLTLITLFQNLGTMYYEQYKDDKAIPYIKKAYELAQKVKPFSTKKDAALNMAVVEENRNNLSKAIVYRKEYDQWKDSLNDQNKVWAVSQLEKKFAVKQKQKEVNLLTAENKTRLAERKGLLSSLTLLLILLAGAAYFYRQKLKQNKIISAQKAILDDLNATKDKLFSIVSHDLRSSVNALKSSNAKLQKNLSTQDYSALNNQLETNSAIANGTYNLLDNLLNWALLQTQQSFFYQESAHLLSLVNQVVYNYEPIMKNKGIVFENKIGSSLYVFVDPDSFKIILRNLIDNAIKFTPETGTVKVYSLPAEEGFVTLVVEDLGKGMPEEKRQELLQPTVLLSKKGKEEGVGTGLGMQLCKSLIERNDGKFDIESEVNKGTKMIVHFRLPAVAD